MPQFLAVALRFGPLHVPQFDPIPFTLPNAPPLPFSLSPARSRVHADTQTTRHVQMEPCFPLGVCEVSETQTDRLVSPPPPCPTTPPPEPRATPGGNPDLAPGFANGWLRTRKTKRPALRRRGRATDAQDC
ncbi:unnamed protein product [Ixodes persulcatus]